MICAAYDENAVTDHMFWNWFELVFEVVILIFTINHVLVSPKNLKTKSCKIYWMKNAAQTQQEFAEEKPESYLRSFTSQLHIYKIQEKSRFHTS